MRRIRQAPVSQRIRCQQVTEFVIHTSGAGIGSVSAAAPGAGPPAVTASANMHQPVRRARIVRRTTRCGSATKWRESLRIAPSASSMKSLVEKPTGLCGGRSGPDSLDSLTSQPILYPSSVDCKIEYINRPNSSPQYLPALTGLRFLLGIWVILHHLTSKGGMLLDQWKSRRCRLPCRAFSRGGYLAVQTFFLLSGFVLAQSYSTTRWNRHSLKRFAVARFARIYPAYLFSLRSDLLVRF